MFFSLIEQDKGRGTLSDLSSQHYSEKRSPSEGVKVPYRDSVNFDLKEL